MKSNKNNKSEFSTDTRDGPSKSEIDGKNPPNDGLLHAAERRRVRVRVRPAQPADEAVLLPLLSENPVRILRLS